MKTKMCSKIGKKHKPVSVKNHISESISNTEISDGEMDIEMYNVDDESDVEMIKSKRKKITDELKGEVSTKKKKLDKSFYKQPTVEELNQLKETENLFHSNLFRLQIEEMLNEVRLKPKYKRLFNSWFEGLKECIKSIEETDEFQIDDNKLLNSLNIKIPLPDVPKETKGTFKFLKPSNISVVGAYPFDGCVGPDITIDVMVEMPLKIIQKQDYQNYRYLRKKALYMAYIASNIQDDIAENKSFVGDNLRPILSIIPGGKLNKRVTVLIHVSVQEDSFKLIRFSPEKNSIRPGWYFNDTASMNEPLPPTPHYNSIITHDLTMAKINSQNVEVIKEYPNVRDGIILLKIWLTQRQLLEGCGSFSSHIVTMYVLYLLSIKKLNTYMSSYQIVRNVWNNLIHVNWSENGISMCQNTESLNQITEYQNYYDCVFLDTTGYHNIAACLSKSTFSWVQREAELCLKHLDSAHADSFQTLFMRKVPFYKAFDHLICFKDMQMLENIVNTKATKAEKINYGPDKRTQAIRVFNQILTEGLGNRVSRICVLPDKIKKWQCTEEYTNDIGKIVIGLELNPEHCFNIVDKGPEANLPEASAFRKFWGEKSELRRFQDGSIREAVVWSEGKTLAEKRIICKNIVTFLLKEKLDLLEDQFLYVANELEDLLTLNTIRLTHFKYGTGEEAAIQVIKSLDTLEKELMSLKDIPLSINGVQGSSAVFRYTDVFPPLATTYRPDKKTVKEGKTYLILQQNLSTAPKYVQPLELSLQLSTSGKWPDELEAVRKTKGAFHIQIAECLRKQHQLKASGTYSHTDVFKDGFVFRLRVAHQKEVALLKQQVDENGVIKYRDNDESIELETKLFELPKLSGALHGLHSQQPSFGSACCLTKRWLSAQLLDNSHIPDVVVELLVASTYLIPEPYKPPQMPQVAFLRILDIFARGHWATDPVIVNFNNEMSREEIVAVETLFGSSRNSLPPLFISTPYDQQKSLWTVKAPTLLILNRISALAKESLKLFEDQLFLNNVLDFKPMFRPPMSEYDCLIYLKPRLNPRRLQAVDASDNQSSDEWHPYKQHSMRKIPVVDFDPVQLFLKELRDGYSEFALFFHDTYGGMIIGVLLKPTALQPRNFKTSETNCKKVDENGKLVVNFTTMIQDFHILGKGLVDAIDVRSKNFALT